MDLSVFSLKGRIAIVTGAGGHMAKVIALSFAQAGADIILPDVNASAGEATAQEICALGRQAMALPADLLENEQVENMVSKVMERFGKIDILCNVLGGALGIHALVTEMSEEDWDLVINRNLRGTFLCSRAVSKVMMKQKKGNIINISGGAGQRPFPGGAAYGVAKAGVINFTQTLSIELAPYHIRVNSISPGPIGRPGKLGFDRSAENPLGITGRFEDIAAAAIYLASDASAFVTGFTIDVRGGPMAKRQDVEKMFQMMQEVPG